VVVLVMGFADPGGRVRPWTITREIWIWDIGEMAKGTGWKEGKGA
jgi:hypothetical protein